MRGDDVKMLQTVLWYLGFSERDTPGAGGTAVKITGTFSKYPHSYVDDGATITMDAGTYQGVVRLQTRDQVDVNGKVDENTLGKIKKHWGDYVKAFNAFSSSPIVSKEHNSFNNWISAGASELKKTYTNEIRDEVDENLTRDKILKAWVEQETGNKGHWGYKVPYRITLGSGDDLGSIGFSQIQNKYKYGGSDKTVKLDNLNLYNPKDGVIGFARWSNEKDMGEGFYRAFVKNSYDVTQVCKNSDGTKKYPYISKKDNSMLTTCYSGGKSVV